MSETMNSSQATRKKRKFQHDTEVPPQMFIFQENHQRKFMKNQNSIENKINSIVVKFNTDISKLILKIDGLKKDNNCLTKDNKQLVKENNELVKENKYLTGRISNNELSIHELRKEMTDLYLSLNNMEADEETCPYIN
jgi:seryl-tRNA synthetase